MLPDLTTYCVTLPTNGQICVTLPGGASMCATFPGLRIPDPSELMLSFMGDLNGALAPLTPIFDIIDVLVAIVNCLKAVEACLGPPPNPQKLIQCLPDLAKKLTKLLQIIPQLTVPVFIGGLLDVIITYLEGVRAQLITVIRKQLRIALAATRAAALGSVALHTVVDCASGDLDAFMVNMSAQGQPLGRLINLLNAFLGVVGLPEIPGIGSIGQDAAAAVTPLTDTILVLQELRKGFP